MFYRAILDHQYVWQNTRY